MFLTKWGRRKQTRVGQAHLAQIEEQAVLTAPSGKDGKLKPPLEGLVATKKMRGLIMLLFAVSCVISVSLTLTWRFEDNVVYSQQAGEAAKDDIVAPKALTYVSQVQSQKASDEAVSNPANNVYRRDETITSKQRENLTALLTLLNKARTNAVSISLNVATLADDEMVKLAGLNNNQLIQALTLNDTQWSEIRSEARMTYNLVTATDIRPDSLAGELARLKNDIYTVWNLSPGFARLDEVSRSLVISLVQPFVTVNSLLDDNATRLKQAEARKKADPVSVSIVKGQSVVRRGEILSLLQIEQLEQLGLRSNASSLQNVIGTVGVITALILLMVCYFTFLQHNIWSNPRMLLFMGMALLIAAAGMRLLVTNYAEHTIRPYILPLAAISMVLAALLDVNLALFSTAVLALMAGYVSQSPEMAAVFFVGGAAGAFTLYKAERTLSFVYAGLAVATGQFAVSLCFDLASQTLDWTMLVLLLIFNLMNGLVSTSLAFFTFSALGKLFGVTTVIQLLELAHPNQPLLRRLMREAPGTYHHSILVSNLAEQAAERLMGDALLARVGAYYHDIGKLSRPSNFIDNQGNGVNIHDNLDPRDSARLIKAHVEDGVILAHKHHLPRKVVDIIHQHHGTCLISFFYQKALAMGLDVSEIDFRYPGPKPQTKVAAIVMLSDGVEAAVRANVQSGRISTGAQPVVPAAQNPTVAPGRKQLTIQDVVNKIIDDRIRDGQLDECDLTLKDIEELRHLFVEILAGIYHPRIVYPDPVRPVTTPETAKQETSTQPEEVVSLAVREIPLEALVGATSVIAVATTDEPATPALAEQSPRFSEHHLAKPGIGGAGRPVQKSTPNDLA